MTNPTTAQGATAGATAGVDLDSEALDKLEALARAATPGIWSWWTSNSTLRLTGADGRDGGVLHAYYNMNTRHADVTCSEADRAFIASFNPAVATSLIALARRTPARVSEAAPIAQPTAVLDAYKIALAVRNACLKVSADYRFPDTMRAAEALFKVRNETMRLNLVDVLGDIGGYAALTQQASTSAPGAPTDFDECVASGQSCQYRPDGPSGEMQCRYCGAAQPERAAASQAAPDVVAAKPINERDEFDHRFPPATTDMHCDEYDALVELRAHQRHAWDERAKLAAAPVQAAQPALPADVRALCMLVAEAAHRNATGGKAMPSDQVRAIVDEALAAPGAAQTTVARDAALEEAAKVCEQQNDTDWPTPLGCAKSIRALKSDCASQDAIQRERGDA